MKALEKDTSCEYQICVVDNGSVDGSREWVEKNCVEDIESVVKIITDCVLGGRKIDG